MLMIGMENSRCSHANLADAERAYSPTTFAVTAKGEQTMTRSDAIDMLRQICSYLTAGNPVWRTEPIREACDMAIEALTEKEPSAEHRWIPVTERLPKYGDKVLVTFHNKYIDRTIIGVSYCYVQKEGFFSDKPFDYAAVAWMPLPQPWKGENDG